MKRPRPSYAPRQPVRRLDATQPLRLALPAAQKRSPDPLATPPGWSAQAHLQFATSSAGVPQ